MSQTALVPATTVASEMHRVQTTLAASALKDPARIEATLAAFELLASGRRAPELVDRCVIGTLTRFLAMHVFACSVVASWSPTNAASVMASALALGTTAASVTTFFLHAHAKAQMSQAALAPTTTVASEMPACVRQ